MKLQTTLLIVGLVLLAGPPLLWASLAAVYGRDQVWSRLFIEPNLAPVDFATLQRASTPNQFLMCPLHDCAGAADRSSPVYAERLPTSRAAWQAMLRDDPRIKLLASSDGDLHHEYEARTSVLRFPGRITMRWIAVDDSHTTFAFYSRSLYGRRDFGANAQRVRGWPAQFEQRLGRERMPPARCRPPMIRRLLHDRAAAVALALIAALPLNAARAADLVITIGNVRNGIGNVLVAVCTEATFLTENCPFTGSTAARPGSVTITMTNIPPGAYAVQSFHDENENNEFDRNFLGVPKEGLGFSNDAAVFFGPPNFADAEIMIAEPRLTISFNLRYY